MKKSVFAFYYPWYWTKDYSGHWSMWDYGGKHDPDRLTNNNHRDISCPHYPEGSVYDSNDPAVIEKHFVIGGDLGIDAFIVSWWGQGNILNRPFANLLNQAEKSRTRVTIYYETVPSIPFKHRNTALDLIEFVSQYGHHPGFLKIYNQPVIFFYRRVIKQHSAEQWSEIIRTVKQACSVLLIADTLDEEIIRLFDGAHTYSPYESYLWRRNVSKSMRHLVSLAKSNNKMIGVSVMPGFDDRHGNNKITLKRRLWQTFIHFKKDVVIERNNGKTYSEQWKWAIESDPSWILICSFNEWIEGTEIEPSIECGTQYLDITKHYVKQFKYPAREEKQRSLI